MLTNVVDASNVIKFDQAITIDVQLVVSLADETKTAVAKVASKRADELIEVDGARVVAVEMLDKNTALLL